MSKALFLDRDGTLIEDIPYLSDPDGVKLLPGVQGALKAALGLGYRLFLFTNQSGIGRGLYEEADAIACNKRLIQLLGLGDNVFSEICIAPEHPDDTPYLYRKPSPRFILEMAQQYELLKEQCYMVGDRLSDTEAAIHAGIYPVRVQTGERIHEKEKALIAEGKLAEYTDLVEFVNTLA